MSPERILIVTSNTQAGILLEEGILRPSGYETLYVAESQMALSLLDKLVVDCFILGEDVLGQSGLSFATYLRQRFPSKPILLIQNTSELFVSMVKHGIWDTFSMPLDPEMVRKTIRHSLDLSLKIKEVNVADIRQSMQVLHRKLEVLEGLEKVGRSITGLLDLDGILTTVVDAAVDMTGAEEGNLLLLDDTTGELYMRAARNFQDDFVRRFRLPIRDSLAGQVMRTGKPLVVNASEPQKIKTSYLIHTLIYVPLTVHNRVIGVLGVDNRQRGYPFQEEHLKLVSSLADYAAIAIENARLFHTSEYERKKLEMVFHDVEDGIILIDPEDRIILINPTACNILNLNGDSYTGRPALDILTHPDIQDLFDSHKSHSHRSEIILDDGRVYNAQVSKIDEVGIAILMQDITYLKELDRIKSDFVNTISHDLRSPLTTILGYVDLLNRVGSVNEQQQEFLQKIRFSVLNITSLLNNILELSRIEAGFDARKEIVSISEVINSAIDRLQSQSKAKRIEVECEIEDGIPNLFGNPSRLLQMVMNILGNAIKFSKPGSIIKIHALDEANQVILQIYDQGPGIPIADQPYIFDKFYRASNVPSDSIGSGLGLAIVKSIVQNHEGRIWVESNVGKGSIFTVVLPVTDSSIS